MPNKGRCMQLRWKNCCCQKKTMTAKYHTGPSILSPLLVPTPDSKGEDARKAFFPNPSTRGNLLSQVRRNGENRSCTPNAGPMTTTHTNPSSLSSNPNRGGSPLRATGDTLFSPSMPPRAESLGDFTSVSSVSTLSRRLTATAKRTMTVRALFDYDPRLETVPPARGLAFNHGDILVVTNANDPVWWQARRMVRPDPPNLFQRRQQFLDSTCSTTTTSSSNASFGSSPALYAHPGPLGLIPSRQQVERRYRSRLRHVIFFNKVTVINGQSLTTTTNPDLPAPASSRPSRPGNPSDANGPTDTDSIGSAATPSPLAEASMAYNGHFSATTASTLDRRPTNLSGDLFGIRSGSLPRTLLKRLSSWGRRKDDSLSRSQAVAGANSQETVYTEELANSSNIRSYEVVVPITISLPRPLLVFGPFKETVILSLLKDPKFSPCVPHTSRPPRPNERNGFDYHFMPSREAMEAEVESDDFIEVGQFQDHLYATSLQAVLEILKLGRVCILDLSLGAVQRLEAAGLHPISVLVKPRSVDTVRTIQRRLTEEQAKCTLEFANRLEAGNWRAFSAIITYDDIDNAVKSIQELVLVHGGPVIWVNPTAGKSSDPQNCLPSGSQSSCLPRSPQQQNAAGLPYNLPG